MTSSFYYPMLCFALLLTFKLWFQTRWLLNLPPGPPFVPILGNNHQLQKPLHHTFHRLSQRYGKIFSLWFGSRLVVVVSSASAAQECFTKNDIVLANRPPLLIAKHIGYNFTTMTFSPYGDHWRNLRRIVALEVLSTNRLNASSEMRTVERMRLIKKLAQESCNEFCKVELRSKFLEMTFNTIMRMTTGKRHWGDDSEVGDVEEAREAREMIIEMMKLGGANNPAEFSPVLRWFDFQNLERRLKRLATRVDTFLQGLVDEHRNGNQVGANTMIDHLLTLQRSQPEYYTDKTIKGLIQVLLLGGIDSTAVTLEWAMTNLLNHPEVLKKTKEEIDTRIGQERLMEEVDISSLPCLQSIISETLRLHPAAPLFIPHMSSDKCSIQGYNIPRGTIVLINGWAIHRDPQIWSDPMKFKPERFENEGEANQLFPFGLGRRVCPGISLARRIVGLTLGLMIQCFEWKRTDEEKIDMSDGAGVTMPKVIPLEAMCKARHPIINHVLS